MRLLALGLAGLSLLFCCGALVVFKLRPIPEESRYVGSATCAGCHRVEHADWGESLHTKMMRRVEAPGVVVADLAAAAEAGAFNPNEPVWAIGGKWEQQFMGHDGEGETLLPGAWHTESEKWDFRAWDGWEVPVPVTRCHGCHTVGLDVETGKFVEPNIGCESCHGPASWHVETRGIGQVYSGVESEVCGQCHVRGRSPSGETFYPADYQPGRDLAEHFVPELPSLGQTSSYWWANGVERKRHQQYTAWSQGGHSNSLESLREDYDGRYGAASQECLSCHSGDYILAGDSRPTVETAQHGVTCAVCHNAHGELDEARLDCADCHGEGAHYHQPERNTAHVACGAGAAVGCADCHMPKTAMIGGRYMLRSHSPGVVTPSDGEAWGMPDSCQNGGCHAGATREHLEQAFLNFYGE